MSSSPLSTPPRNSLDDVFNAMDQDTPVHPRGNPLKRTHDATGGHSEDKDGQGRGGAALTGGDTAIASAGIILNPNHVLAVERFAQSKRLRPEHLTEALSVLQDPPAVRDAKRHVILLAVFEQMGKIVTSTSFDITRASNLTKNMQKYGLVILLSSKISAYKGTVPADTLLRIVLTHRWDLPPGIENNPAEYDKIMGAGGDVLTQERSKIKKTIRWSLTLSKNPKQTDLAPPAKQKNIFQLTQTLVDGTRCTVTVELCARVALMRKVYLEDSSKTFWDALDSQLAAIRTKAAGNAQKIARAFRAILEANRTAHGVNNYQIADGVADDLQEEVDKVIDTGIAAAAEDTGDGAGEAGPSGATTGDGSDHQF